MYIYAHEQFEGGVGRFEYAIKNNCAVIKKNASLSGKHKLFIEKNLLDVPITIYCFETPAEEDETKKSIRVISISLKWYH